MRYRAVSKRRRFSRDKKLKEVYIEHNHKQVKADIMNIGFGGILLRVNALFYLCDILFLHYKTSMIKIEVRHTSGNYYGCSFIADDLEVEIFLHAIEKGN